MNSRILKTDMEELEWGVVTNVCKHSIWGGWSESACCKFGIEQEEMIERN